MHRKTAQGALGSACGEGSVVLLSLVVRKTFGRGAKGADVHLACSR